MLQYPQNQNQNNRKKGAQKPMTDNTDTRQPWEQLPEETNQNYQRFLEYLELGHNRNCTRLEHHLAQKGHKVGRHRLSNISSKHKWRKRAAAYDEHQRHLRKLQLEQDNEQNRQQRITMLKKFQQKATHAIENLDTHNIPITATVADMRLMRLREISHSESYEPLTPEQIKQIEKETKRRIETFRQRQKRRIP
jgi:hypothetical protein